MYNLTVTAACRLPNTAVEKSPYYTSDGVLVLAHATSADSGDYTCTATNAWGNYSASTVITIELPSGKHIASPCCYE